MLGKELGQSKLVGQLKHLRDLNLEQIEKPKTLVILHYCGKRISVPLFDEVSNIAQLLYHHIAKLEQAILSNQPAWEKNSKAQIVCFEIKKQGKESFKPEKQSDGDLRSDVLLSLLRIENSIGQQSQQQLSFRVDVTKVYKYLEIQPFYRYFEQGISHNYHYNQNSISKINQISQFPYFQFHRIISQSKISSIFLARKISNGHFYAVKVYSNGAKMGMEDLRAIENMQYIDDMRKDDIKSSLLVKSHQIALIPHPQVEEGESDDENTCKYIALTSPFFVRGTLQQLLKDARYNKAKRIVEMDCLNYLKELMWGAHLLHQKYNLIHRAIVPSNLSIDQNGQIKLSTYFSSVPCYDSNGNYATYSAKGQRGSSYYPRNDLQLAFEQQQYDIGEFTAPQILKGQPYNYLVDFYSIGVIIRKLYELSQAYERIPVSQNNENLMMTMINRLTSPDLAERETIVSQIVEDIERENLETTEAPLPLSNLVLQDIKLGRQIEFNENKKYIQNQQSYNEIDLEVITNYFRKPKIKISPRKSLTKKTVKKVSKQKQSVKNSRQKSQKCLSKVSAQSQGENYRKISKKKVGSLSKQSHNSLSRESKVNHEQKIRKQPLQVSSQKKTSKSKSHEKKKKEQVQSSKLINRPQQDRFKQTLTPILPKSPKLHTIVTRNKSPNTRDKNK